MLICVCLRILALSRISDMILGDKPLISEVVLSHRWYGSGKPSSLPLTCAWLKRTASMAVLGEKLRRVPWTTQPGWEVESRALFLRSSPSVQPCWWLMKGYHIRGPPTGSVCRAYVDWHGKRTYRVGQVFPCRVYINSNRHDSQMWVTACSWLPSSSNFIGLMIHV
jgi:hypothetical protein